MELGTITSSKWASDLNGIIYNISVSLTYPNATNVLLISEANYDPTELDPYHYGCSLGNPTAGWANVQLNATGSYTAYWNFTWTYASSVNAKADPVVCTGLGSSETFLFARQFNVTGTSRNGQPPAGGQNVVTASSQATFSSKPTGRVYSAAVGSPRVGGVGAWSLMASCSLAGLVGVMAAQAI